MADSNIFLHGDLEDAQGRKLRPATSGAMVQVEDGKTLDAKIAELLDMFAGYIPKNGGGTINGSLETLNGHISADQWLGISSGSDGHALFGQNCYKNHYKNTYHYLRTHESMGAKGLIFRHGSPGLYYFDTGMTPTVKDQEFTPTFQRLDKPDAALITSSDLNQVRENGAYCGAALQNAPYGSEDWWYVFVQNLTDNASNYCVQRAFAINQQAAYYRTLRNGIWQPWERFITETGGNISGTLTVLADGGNGLQLVGSTHVYVPIYKNGIAGGRSGYIGYPDGAATVLEINNEVSGGAVRLKAQGGVYINDRKIPTSYAATWAPLSTDGQDGDVWDVYV